MHMPRGNHHRWYWWTWGLVEGGQGQAIRLELGKLPSGGGGGGIEVQIHGGEKEKTGPDRDWRLNGRA
jgi:hypothetical protein